MVLEPGCCPVEPLQDVNQVPAASDEMAEEVEHESRLQGAHQQVVTLDVHFELGEDFQGLPAANDSNRLQNSHYDEREPGQIL